MAVVEEAGRAAANSSSLSGRVAVQPCESSHLVGELVADTVESATMSRSGAPSLESTTDRRAA